MIHQPSIGLHHLANSVLNLLYTIARPKLVSHVLVTAQAVLKIVILVL